MLREKCRHARSGAKCKAAAMFCPKLAPIRRHAWSLRKNFFLNQCFSRCQFPITKKVELSNICVVYHSHRTLRNVKTEAVCGLCSQSGALACASFLFILYVCSFCLAIQFNICATYQKGSAARELNRQQKAGLPRSCV